MSYYFNDFEILLPSIKGDNIVARDFKNKTILFRVEVNSLIEEAIDSEDKERGYAKTYATRMYIITKEIDEYIFHTYYGGFNDTFSTSRSRYSLLNTAKYNYDKCTIDRFSSLGSSDYLCSIEHYYSIALMSEIEPLIRSIETLVNRERRFMNKKYKTYQKTLKSD